MDDIHLERFGGMANFGGAGSAIRSTGTVSSEQLSPAERAAVQSLFAEEAAQPPAGAADMFRYRVTWQTEAGEKTIEVPESALPPALRNAVRDELR